MNKLKFYLLSWLTIPHILAYSVSKNRNIIAKDVVRWSQCAKTYPFMRGGVKSVAYNLVWLLLSMKEFRNVFYLRIGKGRSRFLKYLAPLSSLHIWTKSENFGAGTYIQHGFATVITAEKVGENCWINQQVTIGYNDSKKYGYGRPTIGNNVRVSAGAKVCGKITVGDNSIIGMNAVVIKDVPEGSTVVPSPMILIREHGEGTCKKF